MSCSLHRTQRDLSGHLPERDALIPNYRHVPRQESANALQNIKPLLAPDPETGPRSMPCVTTGGTSISMRDQGLLV